jgi:hypothetical protein
MPTDWAAVAADLQPAAAGLFLLACWSRQLFLLLGLLVALRRVRGAHRAAMYAQFARALRRCRHRSPRH